MSKQDPRKAQTCVLRVNIDCECDGCKTKIRKLFHKIDGVYATSIDVEEGKVTVTGNVDPNVLIRKLEKSGKHAELWGSQKGSNNNKKKNEAPVGNAKEKKTKQKNQFGEQQIAYQQLIREIKGSEDMKPPFKVKEQKTLKFNLPNKDDGYGDLSGDGSDEDYEENDGDDEFAYGAHKKHEALPIMGKHKKGGGGGKAKKKASDGFMAMIGKAIGGKSEGKNGKGGKSKGGSGGGGGGGKGSAQGKGGGKRGGKASQRNRGGGGGGAAYLPAPAALLAPAPPFMMNMNGSNPYYHSEQQYKGMMYGRQQQVPSPAYYHDPVATMFSDENTNACSIM